MEITDENIAEALNLAVNSKNAFDLIQELLSSGKFVWDYYGHMQRNANLAEAAELSPIETLVEKVTNQIDALIEWKANENNKTDLKNPREAITTFSPFSPLYPKIPEGRVYLSSEIHGVSDMAYYDCEIRFVESGTEDRPTIVFADRGCGNAVSEATTRILSLNQGNKNDRPYFIGAFGRGGSTYLRHCKGGFSIVMSRPRNSPESDLVCWTIIWKVGGVLSEFKATENARTGYYQMLVNKDKSIPAIPAEIFKKQYCKFPRVRVAAADFPSITENILHSITKGETSYNGEYGTFVKLFEFDFHVAPRANDRKALAQRSLSQAGWSCLNSYLFDLPYPVVVTDSRDVQKEDIYRYEDGKGRPVSAPTEKFPYSRMIYGNVSRLNNQWQKKKLKDFREFERKYIHNGEEHGSMIVRIWFFKGDSDGVKIDSYTEADKSLSRIFLTLNGQTIFKETREWRGFEELGLSYLPMYTLFQVELDNLSNDVKIDLFDSARKIFDEAKMASILFDELKDVIQKCPNLDDYENYYEELYRETLSQDRNAKLERQLRRLIAEPGFQILNPRGRKATKKWKTRRPTKYSWIERDPPTWIDPSPAGELEISIGEEKRIQLRHNGPPRLFSRKIKCGRVETKWELNRGFLATSSGSTITVALPQTLKANEEDVLIVQPIVGRKVYPIHKILIRAIPSSFEAVDPPTRFNIVKSRESIKTSPGATFKISIGTDACDDLFSRPDSKWKLKWEASFDQPGMGGKIQEKMREFLRNGRMGIYFEVAENIEIETKFVLSVQLINDGDACLTLPPDSIKCEIIMKGGMETVPKDWYEKRKRISSGKDVLIKDVYEKQWGKLAYEDWTADTPGTLAPGWQKSGIVTFLVNYDCDPYKRARSIKDPKWQKNKEKDNLYRLLLCGYIWDYENRKKRLQNVTITSELKELEQTSARSVVEMIMQAIEQLVS